jgi:hypothetical protein
VLVINGNLTGSSTNLNIGAVHSAGYTYVNGDVIATQFGPGIGPNGNNGVLIVSGNLIDGPTGVTASTMLRNLFNTPTTTTWEHREFDGFNLSTQLNDGTEFDHVPLGAPDYPAESDVRDGVDYAFANFTGTCVVPPATLVAAGAPVDDTVGTGAVDVGTLAAAVGAQIAAATTA